MVPDGPHMDGKDETIRVPPADAAADAPLPQVTGAGQRVRPAKMVQLGQAVERDEALPVTPVSPEALGYDDSREIRVTQLSDGFIFAQWLNGRKKLRDVGVGDSPVDAIRAFVVKEFEEPDE